MTWLDPMTLPDRGCRAWSLVKLPVMVLAMVLVMLGVAPTIADDPPGSPTPPASEPADRPAADPPSLDDLLDIEPVPGGSSGDADADAEVAESDRRALDAALAEQQPSQAFRAAVEDMLVSTELLGQRQSTGLGTQRLQQRIVDRLQALIDAAARQQQQQQQSSGSSQQQQQQEPGKRSEQPQQPQDGQQQQGERNRDGTDGQSVQPPPPESADLQGALEGTGVEWGNLPPRMRDLVTQGLRDRVSEVYRSLTEAYYKRMAEEGDR